METYKLSDETRKIKRNTVLHRVIALPGNSFVEAGTQGGWIENESNLLDGGWVADNACVYDNAIVGSGALIKDKARIYDMARVFGECVVSDRARVFGNAALLGFDETDINQTKPIKLCGTAIIHDDYWNESPYYVEGSVWPVNISSRSTLRIGCYDYTLRDWKESYYMKFVDYSDEIVKKVDSSNILSVLQEYIGYFNHACELLGKPELKTNVFNVLCSFAGKGFQLANS
mgnify:CR=1 FL=1